MKKNIALVTGGYSGELEISLKSAGVVKDQIDLEKYEVYMVYIDRTKWVYIGDGGEETSVDRNDFSVILKGKKIFFDAVFMAIHGTPGEDGKLQGYFDLLDIPYTSCGTTTSAVTFNKYFTNRIARCLGLNTADSIFITRFDSIDADHIFRSVGLPCFVKPNNGGSSVGVTKVEQASELPAAIEKAFGEDHEIVVENFISGFEITCGMINFKGADIIFPLTEIVSKKEFFDYEAKYSEGMADEITPARVTEPIEKECKRISAYLYHELSCRGIVRFDYIVSGERLFFLEVNTVPGLSEASIVPKQIRTMGMTLREVYSMAIEDAFWRRSLQSPVGSRQ
ncbi:MAG: D-alanine--D-alanine ligase [Bacteroidetes bacterium]|nr:D-alanine--D-alanine ligase [Bacteroidota bacterium]